VRCARSDIETTPLAGEIRLPPFNAGEDAI
jgi:hypothetical protein